MEITSLRLALEERVFCNSVPGWWSQERQGWGRGWWESHPIRLCGGGNDLEMYPCSFWSNSGAARPTVFLDHLLRARHYMNYQILSTLHEMSSTWYLYLIDDKTEAQRGWVTCSRTHS